MYSLIESHEEILLKLVKLEKKDLEKDEKIRLIFKFLKMLEKSKVNEQNFKNKNPIGYKRKKEL